jgi:hypothetical protein
MQVKPRIIPVLAAAAALMAIGGGVAVAYAQGAASATAMKSAPVASQAAVRVTETPTKAAGKKAGAA